MGIVHDSRPQPITAHTPTHSGTKSPTSDSTDSAISDDQDIVAVSVHQTRKTGIYKGFANPTFRRCSSKSINLDSPSIQVSLTTPPIMTTPPITTKAQSDDVSNESINDDTTIDTGTATEV